MAPAAAGSEPVRAMAKLCRAPQQLLLLLSLSLSASSTGALASAAGGRVLRGQYPDFLAPLPAALPAASCDATAAPCAARGDGSTDDTAALQHCIDHCQRGSDGRFAVVLKAGHRFLTGSLNLTSGLTLVVDGTVSSHWLSHWRVRAAACRAVPSHHPTCRSSSAAANVLCSYSHRRRPRDP